MLAGIIQRPNYFNPFRHPERTIERRNLVLDSMVETGAISKEQAERAKDEPLHLIRQRRRQRGALLCGPGARSAACRNLAIATSIAKVCASTRRLILICSGLRQRPSIPPFL